MVENNKQDIVDLKKMFQKIIEKEMGFVIALGVASAIAIILKYYTTNNKD